MYEPDPIGICRRTEVRSRGAELRQSTNLKVQRSTVAKARPPYLVRSSPGHSFGVQLVDRCADQGRPTEVSPTCRNRIFVTRSSDIKRASPTIEEFTVSLDVPGKQLPNGLVSDRKSLETNRRG